MDSVFSVGALHSSIREHCKTQNDDEVVNLLADIMDSAIGKGGLERYDIFIEAILLEIKREKDQLTLDKDSDETLTNFALGMLEGLEDRLLLVGDYIDCYADKDDEEDDSDEVQIDRGDDCRKCGYQCHCY